MKKSKFKFSWKQNIRKISSAILTKIRSFKKDDFVVAYVKKISVTDISAGKYMHIGIKLNEDKVVFEADIIPNGKVGKFSRINVEGEEITRKDLPKVSKPFSWDTPNFGDWSRGSHEITRYRDVYQKDFRPPRELSISTELLGEEVKAEKLFVFKFQIDEVVNRVKRGFKDRLFYCLNLLQENVGGVDVFPSDAKLSDYLKTIYVNWEILPPGERDNNIARILSGIKAPSKELKEKLIARYDVMAKLKPLAFIAGTSGFRRYFGAKINDDLVAFENLEYGNALYVMFDDWESLSKMSRIDLLSSKHVGFQRIVHQKGWEAELKKIVKEKLGKA